MHKLLHQIHIAYKFLFDKQEWKMTINYQNKWQLELLEAKQHAKSCAKSHMNFEFGYVECEPLIAKANENMSFLRHHANFCAQNTMKFRFSWMPPINCQCKCQYKFLEVAHNEISKSPMNSVFYSVNVNDYLSKQTIQWVSWGNLSCKILCHISYNFGIMFCELNIHMGLVTCLNLK